MKKLAISVLSLLWFLPLNAEILRTELQVDNSVIMPVPQELRLTATTTAATRLFSARNDLTTVIMIIPKGSVVEITGTDTTYFRITFEDYEGYILRRHAKVEEPAEASKPEIVKAEPVIREPEPAQEQQGNRFTYLENKYGTSMASRMIAGKIWKGMTSDMVNDTWGSPQKINRVISGNTVKEEWIYKNTWLYIEDDILREWGPVK